MERMRHFTESPAVYGPMSVLELFLDDVRKVPLLSREEEIDLFKRIEAGRNADMRIVRANGNLNPNRRESLEMDAADGKAAKEHVLRANLRLVISIAVKYQNNGVEFLDLIQSGFEGLDRATEKYDYKRGNRFSTYAYEWIRNKVQREIANHGRTVRVPINTMASIYELIKHHSSLSQELGREPTPEELAQVLSLKPKRVRLLIRTNQHQLSLDMPIGEKAISTFADFVPANETETPHAQAERKMLTHDLNKLLATLEPREERILRMRFGLDNGIRFTLDEVGLKLEITRERVRQIEAKALVKLREKAQLMGLSEFLH